MSAVTAPVPALGVGAIVGDSFAVFLGRIVWFTLLAFVPFVVFYGVLAMIVGSSVFEPSLDGSSGMSGVVSLAVQFGQVVVFSLTGGFLVQAAYDAKLGHPVRLGEYVAGTLRQIVPLVLCSIVVWIGIVVAMTALIVPGIWLLAVWSVVVPAIVIEGGGFSALGRSAALTKGYRWPIVGTLVLLTICMAIAGLVLFFFVGTLLAAIGGLFGLIAGAILYALMSGVSYGIYFVGIALIYARLREIKEGISVETLAEVFA